MILQGIYANYLEKAKQAQQDIKISTTKVTAREGTLFDMVPNNYPWLVSSRCTHFEPPSMVVAAISMNVPPKSTQTLLSLGSIMHLVYKLWCILLHLLHTLRRLLLLPLSDSLRLANLKEVQTRATSINWWEISSIMRNGKVCERKR